MARKGGEPKLAPPPKATSAMQGWWGFDLLRRTCAQVSLNRLWASAEEPRRPEQTGRRTPRPRAHPMAASTHEILICMMIYAIAREIFRR
jgi:hypothetical protein